MLEYYLHESDSATVESRMHQTWSHDRSWIIDYTHMRRMNDLCMRLPFVLKRTRTA